MRQTEIVLYLLEVKIDARLRDSRDLEQILN